MHMPFTHPWIVHQESPCPGPTEKYPDTPLTVVYFCEEPWDPETSALGTVQKGGAMEVPGNEGDEGVSGWQLSQC